MSERHRLHPVILCGGSGTRLWPLSRMGFPKQFLVLTSQQSLLQQTLTRVTGDRYAPPIVVGAEEHRFMIADHLQQIRLATQRIILEPAPRSTAAATALAAFHLTKVSKDAMMLVLPADHVIQDPGAFETGVAKAIKLAQSDHLVTFGVEPTGPETGYGYIIRGEESKDVPGGFAVRKFVEKPSQEKAAAMLAAGDCSWNGGMFLFKASVYLRELKRHEPQIYEAAKEAVNKAVNDADFLRPDAKAFGKSPDISIDYAVMERTEHAAVVPVSKIGWDDVGSWSALWRIGPKDGEGNVRIGDVTTLDTRDCYLHAEDRLVVALGLENVAVVQTDDVIFVSSFEAAHQVKKIVEQLNVDNRRQAKMHSTVHRPWGSFRGVAEGSRYQVKRIVVKPGAKLSMQYHHHRAEHWIVVRGTARVTNGNEIMLLHENQSTYIPLGATHRLENPGKIDLELIEVQSGPYLGEDDIVRVEDVYGRTMAAE